MAGQVPNLFHGAFTHVSCWDIPQCNNFTDELLCSFKGGLKIRLYKRAGRPAGTWIGLWQAQEALNDWIRLSVQTAKHVT